MKRKKDMEKTLLAVDDIDATLAVIYHTLKRKYNVVKKKNGKEALDWLQEGNIPDVIISDLNMPIMDGMEFINQIRSSGFFKDIPCVILSSHENSSVRIQCLRCGADDFLVKPFNPEELEARIENIIKRTSKVA